MSCADTRGVNGGAINLRVRPENKVLFSSRGCRALSDGITHPLQNEIAQLRNLRAGYISPDSVTFYFSRAFAKFIAVRSEKPALIEKRISITFYLYRSAIALIETRRNIMRQFHAIMFFSLEHDRERCQ